MESFSLSLAIERIASWYVFVGSTASAILSSAILPAVVVIHF